jgi:general secretion pathway protein D
MRFVRNTPKLVAATAFCLLAAPALTTTAFAQDPPKDPPPAPPPGEDGERKLVLSPQEGGWKIEDLFRQIHKSTGRSILYDSGPQSKVKTGKVDFIGTHIVLESELFDWLQAVLSYQQLVLVPVGPLSPDGKQQWYCLDQSNAMVKTRPVYIDEKDIFKYADRDGLYVVTSVTLKHISDTGRVRTALTALATTASGIGRVQDVPGSRSLILGDFAPVVAAMKRLLDYIDVEDPNIEPQMKVIGLEYAVASELEPIISDLIDSSPQTRNQPRQQGQPDDEPPPKIIPDDRLDALIVYATEKYMSKIETLVRQLDVPTKARTRLNIRPLKHTDAGDMASLLEDLISGTTRSGTSSGRSTSRTNRTNTNRTQPSANQGGAGPFAGGTEGQPVIIADAKSNSLIVHASPTQMTEIDKLIEELDKSRPQVLIETALVELSLNDGLNLGVELFGAQKGIAVDTDGDGTFDAITEAQKFFGASTFDLSNAVSTPVSIGGGDPVNVPTSRSPILGTGFTTGIFKNGKLPIILSALQTSGTAKIVTRPGLVTNDNEQATIELSRETSYRESVRTDTGTDRDNFKSIEAKTILKISPHISSDNYLRLEIEQTVANFGNRPSPDAPPDKTERTIQTNVTVPDQYTVVIGGLVQEEERTSVRKVPILGDIPILGFFFRQTEDTSSPAHLFLFVTPHILRDQDFTDFHRVTWERKLQQDKLFGTQVDLGGANFRDPSAPKSAAEKIRDVHLSGDLDAPTMKARESDEDRIRRAQQTANPPQDGAAPAKDTK